MRRSGFKGLVAAGLVATGIAATTTVVAASDMFLKLKGVTGESNVKGQEGNMEVLSWSWGTSTGDAQTKNGKLPAVCIQDLTLSKLVDLATPDLIMMGVTGEVAPTGRLTVRRSGEVQNQATFLTLDLTNVTVASYQTGTDPITDILTETLVLHFETMHGEYRPQSGSPVPFDVSGVCP